jgi:hypothetical protein
VTYGFFRRRLRHSGAVIARLQDDLERRTQQLDRSLQKEKQLEASCSEATGRLAETALADAQKWWRDDNYNRGNRALAEWLEREGEAISKVLVLRAEWATAHAAGDLRAIGLAVAQAYTTAAISLWPQNRDAIELLGDLTILNVAEAQSSPPVTEALTEFEDRAHEMFEPDLVEAADTAEAEAHRRFEQGHYHAALPTVERALILRFRTVGRIAAQTFRTQRLKSYILDGLGHTDEALPIARAVADACAASPALGPGHPDTLTSRHLVAQLLDALGHTDEALPIARAVADASAASPALGPGHPDTLARRHLVAQLLHRLGHTDVHNS